MFQACVSISACMLYVFMNIHRVCVYTTAKKKRPNQLGYLVGIWL